MCSFFFIISLSFSLLCLPHVFRIQHELEASTKQAIFVDSSINDTIRTCIVLRNNRAAAKVKSEFKVSDKRWYWLKAFALATIKDWDALEKFSKEKRPPTGKFSYSFKT